MDAEIIRELLGCQLSNEEATPGGFNLAMSRAWNFKGLRVSRVRGSILHVFFPDEKVKERVMESGPWCFDNNLIVMVDWGRDVDPLNFGIM
ncbi:hypothetical protein LIER_03262 [Lithospermum erythrorhizon]|uniref:DUF4283 domain-containing protein n=1 Tax=Lithospermum erythrorhizon TaxID=34254 RepID=A0AAV3NWE6_LITER